MITLTADSRRATATSDEPITTGSVGIPVHVMLSAEFDNLQAVVTFRAGAAAADVALLGQMVTVPTQLLTQAGRRLMVGVYGAREDGTVVIPTVWAHAGIVQEGTRPSGVDPADPAPSWAAQVQAYAEDAHETAERLAGEVDGWEADVEAAVAAAEGAATDASQAATDLRAAAERGDFDGADGYSPTVSIESTASEHTITITDKDGEHTYVVDTYADEEAARAAAEALRVAAESERVSAESARASAESARATAETARANAETARANAETARVTAEDSRASAESARTSAEDSRASAESTRSANETARASAETARATEWATIKFEAASATQSASDAASAATAAAEAALERTRIHLGYDTVDGVSYISVIEEGE